MFYSGCNHCQLNVGLLASGNPHYLPEVTAKALVVDFGVRQPGLEAQLLDTIVRHERPDLDQQKGELVLKVAQGKQTQVRKTTLKRSFC